MSIPNPLNTIKDNLKDSSKLRLDKCKEDPATCLQQIVVDGLAIVAMYILALYVVDGLPPSSAYVQNNAIKFLGLYISCSYLLRYLDVDYEDALSRGAAMVVAAKFVSVMAPAVAAPAGK